MKWITRERPKIDRIACPWLIATFIDKEPEFLYVPARDVMPVAEKTGAVPYDIPGVELSHVGELCSFDAFLNKYQLTDPVLAHDAALGIVYLASESGVLSAFKVSEHGVAKVGKRFVGASARTVALEPRTHKVYLPLKGTGTPPVLRVMRPVF